MREQQKLRREVFGLGSITWQRPVQPMTAEVKVGWLTRERNTVTLREVDANDLI